jgi:hypothetical protein
MASMAIVKGVFSGDTILLQGRSIKWLKTHRLIRLRSHIDLRAPDSLAHIMPDPHSSRLHLHLFPPPPHPPPSGKAASATAAAPERQLTLTNIIAPRFGRSKNAQDEPFAFESREWLRRKLLGKSGASLELDERQRSHVNSPFNRSFNKRDPGRESNIYFFTIV